MRKRKGRKGSKGTSRYIRTTTTPGANASGRKDSVRTDPKVPAEGLPAEDLEKGGTDEGSGSVKGFSSGKSPENVENSGSVEKSRSVGGSGTVESPKIAESSGSVAARGIVQKAEMPYERFNAVGKENLTNTELIAILLRSGTREEPVLDLAARVLQIHENPENRLGVLYEVSKEELMKLPGIGEVKAVRLLAVLELSRRLAMENVLRTGGGDGTSVQSLVCDNPDMVAHYYMESLRHEQQERVMALFLDTHLSLIRAETLTIGSVDASICSPRDIFRRALQAGASNLVLLHNHPSGNPTPSVMDIKITEQVSELGEVLGVHLVDHLIIGDLCYTSMKQKGYLNRVQQEKAEEDGYQFVVPSFGKEEAHSASELSLRSCPGAVAAK